MKLFHYENQTYVLRNIVHVSNVWDEQSPKITVTMIGGEEYHLYFHNNPITAKLIREKLIEALELA